MGQRVQTRRTSIPDEVFAHLPYGLVIVDGDGGVVGWNDAAERLLPAVAAGDGGNRCDELFACGGPGGPCERGCLAARAAQGAEPLPEIRIDAARDGGATALWVTASPLGHESRAVLHLRAGDARDRRRRSDPHWLSGPELRVRTFGRTRVDTPEGPIGGQWLQQRPGHVLKYLICERNRVVYAEEMAEALWPGSGRQGLGNVRHFIHQLRDRLEPDRPKRAPSSFVVAVRGGYAINRRHVRIDADELEAAAGEGLAAFERGDEAVGREFVGRALDLYTGEFFADEPYTEWAYEERNRLRGIVTRCLRALVTVDTDAGDARGAAAHLQRLTELEPYDAEVHRELFSAWLAQGRRTEAAHGFASFRSRMMREFGEEPEFDLASLRAGLAGAV